MKRLTWGLITIVLSSTVVHALNPTRGWYAGLIAGGSKPPVIDFDLRSPIDLRSELSPLNLRTGQGELTYSVLGNVGGQLGYRMKQFRVEGEFLYNNNPYKHLKLGALDIPNAGSPATTIQQLSIESRTLTQPFTFSGYTRTFAVMLNGFYDFYIPHYTEHVVPYVGLGIGYEQVKNSIAFFNNGNSGTSFATSNSSGFHQDINNFAAQGIVGLSYFVTDYTSFSFDYRYLSSTRTNQAEKRFNSFSTRPQIYSVNFVFNSAFNLG